MHVRGAVGVDRDLGDLGDVGLECLVNGDPPTASCREWRAPTRLARREVQHREVARRLAEQVAAVLVRVLLRRLGQLVDEALHHERVERVVHRAPEPDGDPGVGQDVVHVDVGDRIRHTDAALDGFPIEPVLHCVGEHPRHDGRRHDAVRPGHRLAGGIEAGPQGVTARRAVLRVAHVVLAGPHHLDGRAGGLRRLERLPEEVQLEPPPEAPAQVRRVHFDLLGRHAADSGAQPLGSRLELRRGPDVYAVGADVRGAVHRLHRGVGEERQLVHGIELRRRRR